MGDSAEVFNALRQGVKERRAKNTVSSTSILRVNKIPFESKNNGAHLIVEGLDGDVFDFWPSTGLFISRKTGLKRRGVRKLLGFCIKSENYIEGK